MGQVCSQASEWEQEGSMRREYFWGPAAGTLAHGRGSVVSVPGGEHEQSNSSVGAGAARGTGT